MQHIVRGRINELYNIYLMRVGKKLFVKNTNLTRDLTRFAIQAKGPDGKWTRKPLAYRESNNVHLLITRPPEICVNLVFKQTNISMQNYFGTFIGNFIGMTFPF